MSSAQGDKSNSSVEVEVITDEDELEVDAAEETSDKVPEATPKKDEPPEPWDLKTTPEVDQFDQRHVAPRSKGSLAQLTGQHRSPHRISLKAQSH